MAASLEFLIVPKVKTNSMTKVNDILTKSRSKFKKFENAGTKAYSKIKSGTTALIRKQEQLNNKFKKSDSNLKKLAKVAVGYFSVAAVKNFYSTAISGANDQIAAETKLTTILKNVQGLRGDTAAIKAGTKELKNYASQLQELGVIGDEVTIAGQAQLATFQLMPDTIKTLSGGMLDLLANTKGLNAGQGDAMNVANMLGKAMMGQANALTRVGISLSDNQAELIKTGTESQRAAVLAEVLQQNVGGVNAALAKTDPGKIVNATNAWGDMKEEVGKGVLPVLAKVFQGVKKNLPEIQAGILKVTDILITGTAVLWKFRKPILLITGAYLAFNAALVVNSFLLTSYKAITQGVVVAQKVFTAGQWLLNAALTANPIGLVIAGVALLGAGFVLAYKKIEPFRNFINDLWDKLSNSTFGQLIGKLFGGGSSEITLKNEKTIKGSSAAINGSSVNTFNTNTTRGGDTTISQPITVNGGIDSKGLERKIKRTVDEHNREQFVALGAGGAL